MDPASRQSMEQSPPASVPSITSHPASKKPIEAKSTTLLAIPIDARRQRSTSKLLFPAEYQDHEVLIHASV
jgi:hypothetical protein